MTSQLTIYFYHQSCIGNLYICFGWQDEKRLRKALYFANVCGALTVTQRGAIPALPSKEAILQFLLEAAVI